MAATSKSDIVKVLIEVGKKNSISISSNKFDASLKSVGIDSLQGINLIIQVEEKFKVQIEDSKLKDLKTPNDIVNCIFDLVNKKK